MTYPDNIPANFDQRDPADGVDELFYKRWSPRSFQKVEIDASDIKTIIDAARWSPSCFNEQPWRIYTSTPATFERFLGLLMDGNQQWAKNASVLGFMVRRLTFEKNDKENLYGDYDTGAAWMAMTLQARKMGLYTHGMAGIHKSRVYEELGIDKETYKVIAGFAMGVIDSPDKLSDDKREREIPSDRKPLEEIWFPVSE